jgi:hypothetical protein
MQFRAQLIRWAGAIVPALYLLGCMAACVVVGWAGAFALSGYPGVARVFVIGVAILGGLGGLCSFWSFMDGLEFVGRGYRIRSLHSRECGVTSREYWGWRLGPNAWAYEEWASEGGIHRLSFVREALDNGYPALTRVHLPGEDAWDSRAPAWARGRRAEIVKRIAECGGPRTQFADLEGPPDPEGLQSAKPDVPS